MTIALPPLTLDLPYKMYAPSDVKLLTQAYARQAQRMALEEVAERFEVAGRIQFSRPQAATFICHLANELEAK